MWPLGAAMRLGWFLPCATLCFVLKERPEGVELLYGKFVPIFDDDFVGLSRTGRDLTDLSVESHFGDLNSLNLGGINSDKGSSEHPKENAPMVAAASKAQKQQKEFIPSPIDEMVERIGKSLGRHGQNHLSIGGGRRELEPAPDVVLGSDVHKSVEFVVRASQAVAGVGPREVATHHAVSHNGAAALQTDIIDVSTFTTPTGQSPIPFKELEQTTEGSLDSGKVGDLHEIRANDLPKKLPLVLPHQIERGTGRVILPHYKTSDRDRLKSERKVPEGPIRDIRPSKNQHRLTSPHRASPSLQELAHHTNLRLLKKARDRTNHKTKAAASAATPDLPSRSTPTMMEGDERKLMPDLFETLPKPSHLRDHSNRREQLVTSETQKITHTPSSTRGPFAADLNSSIPDLVGNELQVENSFRKDKADVAPALKFEAEVADTGMNYDAGKDDGATTIVDQSGHGLEQDNWDLGTRVPKKQPKDGLTIQPIRTKVGDKLPFEDNTRNYNQLVETPDRGQASSPTSTPPPVRPILVYGAHIKRATEGKKTREDKIVDDFVPSMRISNSLNPGDAIFYSNRPLSDSEYSKTMDTGSKVHVPYNLIPVDKPVSKDTLGKNKNYAGAGGFRSPRRSDFNKHGNFSDGIDGKTITFPKEEENMNFEPSTEIKQFDPNLEDKFSPMENDINTLVLTATARADGVNRPPFHVSTTTKKPLHHNGLEDNPRWPLSKPKSQPHQKLDGKMPEDDHFSLTKVPSTIPQSTLTWPEHHDTITPLNVIPPPPTKLLPPPKKSRVAKTAQKELFDGAGGRRLIDREGLLMALMKARDRGSLKTGAFSPDESRARYGESTATSKLQLPPRTNHSLIPANLMQYVDQGLKMMTRWLPGGLAFLAPERQYYSL